MGMLEKRAAILTGGAGNLGSHMARLFANEGASVVVNDVNGEAALTLVNEIVAAGGRAVADSSDVATMSGASALVQKTVQEFGTVDIMVLLAGQIAFKPLVDLTEDDWDTVVGTHLKGHFTMVHAAAPIMMANNYGRIIAVASCHGTIGDSNMVPYCAAKSGIIGLARAAAIELDPYNICVNTICPAGTAGENRGPIGTRLVGPPAGNAPLVAYLASEEAGWINGHVFDVSGSGRVGLYPPLIPARLVEQPGGFSLEQLRTVVPGMFDATYTIEPRQRPRLIPRQGEIDDHLPEGLSPVFAEVMSTAGRIRAEQ